ncbi:MAG TPA: radical SAM protein [Spirochaetota bacterium]|nr:radical SAM protein [Spirochaetota bacterium]
MKILLISPCIDPDYKTPKSVMMPQLSLHILSSMTPPPHHVTILEEEYRDIDFSGGYDLVGISCFTSNSRRAYAIADRFRETGVPVVLGGIHPTLLPEEAARHADAVVTGEAEEVWEDIIHDAESGNLQPFYSRNNIPLDRYIPVTSLQTIEKGPFSLLPVQTTRGCPYDCEFCSVSKIYGRTIRHAPVENVVRYIEESGGSSFIFLDDNIIGDRRYARELFQALQPLKIRWVGQAPVSLADDPELMKLAVQSGCVSILFGLESVSPRTLKRFRKSYTDLGKISEAIKKIHGSGIHFHASMVFGFDEDDRAIFPETLEFLIRNRVACASFNILTPYPGTRLFKELKAQDRLLTYDWKYYDTETVVFKPKLMTPGELHEGKLWIKKEFFSLPSIIQRLPGAMPHPIVCTIVNLGLRTSARHEIQRFGAKQRELYSDEDPRNLKNGVRELGRMRRLFRPGTFHTREDIDYSGLDN